ncbi:MAG: type I restriction enzyme HsdR N-terminal domain-containing protein [Bacteroidales bacterium]|nr:type I restriction enzyme HsdR N-terminal domain-containing protein [Bacteroidales bacterium]
MQRLNLPTYSINIKSAEHGDIVFDPCRSKWVSLTPEEWVRQNLLMYLTKDLHYPAGLMATEMTLRINQLTRRVDIAVFNRNGQAVLLAECKAPDVPLSQEVFNQVAHYNWNLKVPYLLISNGIKHYCARIDEHTGKYSFMDNIPDYSLLLSQSDTNS